MSVDTDLYPYEVISVIDELESVLNPKARWDPENDKFVGVESPYFFAVKPKKHMDYLVVVCEDKKTRQPKPFPKEFLTQWVTHQRSFYIHPANYGMPPVRRVWNQVTVRLRIADDRTLRTTETDAEEPCSI